MIKASWLFQGEWKTRVEIKSNTYCLNDKILLYTESAYFRELTVICPGKAAHYMKLFTTP